LRTAGLTWLSFLVLAISPARGLPPQLRTDTPASPSLSDGPSFSATSESLRAAAAKAKSDRDAEATILLNEERVSFDADGKMVETYLT
jgi:hypothetical protein